jgi:transcriptional regulator with XRE-family HTH domain
MKQMIVAHVLVNKTVRPGFPRFFGIEVDRIFSYHLLMAAEVRERIRKIRETLNVSQREFAKRIFISQTLLGDIELGNRNVNDRTVQLISTEFKVSKEWLLSGRGDMFTSPPPDLQLEKLIDIFRRLDKPLRDYLLDQSKGLLKLQQEKQASPQNSPKK